MLDRISLESSRVLDGSRKSKNIDNAELVSYTFLSLTFFVIFSGIGYRYEPHYIFFVIGRDFWMAELI